MPLGQDGHVHNSWQLRISQWSIIYSAPAVENYNSHHAAVSRDELFTLAAGCEVITNVCCMLLARFAATADVPNNGATSWQRIIRQHLSRAPT